MKSKIIVFGGSFNPTHKGHIKLAEDAFKFVGADKLFFVPTLNHPTKDVVLYNKADVLNMLKMGINSSNYANKFEIESCELENSEQTSYTYYTIKYLRVKYPEAELYFLIGSDNLPTLSSWFKYDEYKDWVKFIVGKRLGYEISFVAGVKYKIFETSAPEISSSQLREQIKNGENINEYLNKDVADYINSKNLYK